MYVYLTVSPVQCSRIPWLHSAVPGSIPWHHHIHGSVTATEISEHFAFFLSAHPYASSGRRVNSFEYVCLCVSVSKIAGGVGGSLLNVKKFFELPKALEGHPTLVSLLERVFSERDWNAVWLFPNGTEAWGRIYISYFSFWVQYLHGAQDEILMV